MFLNILSISISNVLKRLLLKQLTFLALAAQTSWKLKHALLISRYRGRQEKNIIINKKKIKNKLVHGRLVLKKNCFFCVCSDEGRALEKLEKHPASPCATQTPLSCSTNFPRASTEIAFT